MDFYYLQGSAPCRSILMTAKALGVELNLKRLDLRKGEHLTPEFLEINPQHTIPTLVDNGFVLWESRAILGYLVDKYGKDDTLYPKDAKKRAVVNQRLYFDMGVLYQRFGDFFYPQVKENKPADPEKLKKLEEGILFLENFLENQTYVAGDTLTIADLSIFATISTFPIGGVELKQFANVQKWLSEVSKTAPGVDLNQEGLEEFQSYFKK